MMNESDFFVSICKNTAGSGKNKMEGPKSDLLHKKKFFSLKKTKKRPIFAKEKNTTYLIYTTIMYGKMQSYLQEELKNIQEAGLYKNERVIATPQSAAIRLADGSEVLNFSRGGMTASEYLRGYALETGKVLGE